MANLMDDNHLAEKKVTAETFEDVYGLTFTYPSSDETTVELKENGANIPVKWEDRGEFTRLVKQFRLVECNVQVSAIRSGLVSLIPARFLSLLTWKELELEVCGSPEIDVALLKQNTTYQGCSSTDPHIKYFWTVLEKMTQAERAQFLRFAWGRSRLPPPQKFTEKMKIDSSNVAVTHLPKAHTCFFLIELPKYNSEDVMREKLLKAITLCRSMDLA